MSRGRILATAILYQVSAPVFADDTECDIPLIQNEFVSYIVNGREEHYRTNYANREYALNLETLMLTERASEVSYLLPNADFNGWYAVIRQTVEINDEQGEVIQASLEVGPYISLRLQFHNEIFGDSFDTRVPVHTPLGQQLTAVLEGTEVIVSGRFVRDGGEILEISLTPANAVTHPAYLVELDQILPVDSLTDCMDTLQVSQRSTP